ncbi:MAG: hypothetical protein IH911_02760 [Proteobacteria bacterium]|nr:hypothetical protein [Pseudomonadota bacterium]
MITFKKQVFILIISSGLLACATTGEGDDEAGYEYRSGGTDCISEGTIRDYRVLDDANLVVTAMGNRKYHVELSRRALGLRSTWQIGFATRTGRICPGFDDIVVSNGFGPDRIRIASIRRLNKDELEDLLIRYGKKEPEFEVSPATEDVEGAEVEELD